MQRDAGADVTIGEENGYTPMHGAAFQGRHDVAKYLIQEGLNPNEPHTDGFRPIHRAAWGNDYKHTLTIRVLLKV